jgi:hypothetical protein
MKRSHSCFPEFRSLPLIFSFALAARVALVASLAAPDPSLPPLPAGVPANDAFANRVALTGATNNVTGSNVGATKELGEPNHARDHGGASVWWSWTAPASGPVTISTVGSDFDTLLGVYTGTNVASLTRIAQDDDFGWQRTSQVTFYALAGTEYEIAVDGWQGAAGNISLGIAQATPAPPTILTQPQGSTNNIGDAVSFSVVASGVPPIRYQWFKDGVAMTRPNWEPNFFIRHAQTNDAGNYSVFVSDRLGSVMSSNALLTINPPPPPPANDNFTNRIALTGATNIVNGSNQSATAEPGEPHHSGERGGRSVWWSWTAPANGVVTISTAGSTFDTLLGVYTGTNVAALALVVASDDDPASTNNTSLVTFTASAGVEYEIAVDGWHGAAGAIALNISQAAPSPLAPVILAQPQSLKLFITNRTMTVSASFSVVASNANTFQWRFNGLPLAGATNAALTITNARPHDSGVYSVLVANDYGSALSSNAVLRVLAGRQIGPPSRWGHGGFALPLDSQPSDLPDAPPQITVQVTTNFVNWLTLTNGICLTNGQVNILDPGGTNHPHRFYRILER